MVIAVSVIIVIVIILASVTFLTVNQNPKPEESLAEQMALRAGDFPYLRNIWELKADYIYAFMGQDSSCLIDIRGDYNSSVYLRISPLIRVFNTTQAALEAFNYSSSYILSQSSFETSSLPLGDKGYICRQLPFYDDEYYVIFLQDRVYCELIVYQSAPIQDLAWLSNMSICIGQLQLEKINYHLEG